MLHIIQVAAFDIIISYEFLLQNQFSLLFRFASLDSLFPKFVPFYFSFLFLFVFIPCFCDPICFVLAAFCRTSPLTPHPIVACRIGISFAVVLVPFRTNISIERKDEKEN